MRRLWLIFAQTVTVAVAILFVINTLKPEWLPARPVPLTVHEAPVATPGGGDTLPNSGSYRDAARAALPSVVHIYTTQVVKKRRHPLLDDPVLRHFFGDHPDLPPSRNSGLGSGVLVSANGYILTNSHVVEAGSDIQVSLNDGSTHKATLIGSDPESDIAVLQIKADKLPAITFSQMDNLRVGDVVLAIGNPFGVGQTVTMGIVSALGRSHLGINTFENFIQTDAAINPGNSGGALVNLRGELVGVNTAILSQSGGNMGIGFAIPSNMVKTVMAQLIEFGEVKRGVLGVTILSLNSDYRKSLGLSDDVQGALVSQVLEGSAAAKAGIQAGDVVTSVDGKPVKGSAELRNMIGMARVGDTVEVGLIREGKARKVKAVITEPSAEAAAAAGELHPAFEGAELADAPPEQVAGGGRVGQRLQVNQVAERRLVGIG